MTPRKTSPRLNRFRTHSIEQAHALFAPHVNFRPRAKGRIRLFSPAKTFWLFLWQVLSGNISCSETVQSALAWLCLNGNAKASPNTAAYCKARGRLEKKEIEKLRDNVAENLESRAASDSLFPGRRVRIVDGTGLSMPDTPANQKRFPQSKKQKRGCGFPIMRLVAIFSLATGAIARTAFGSLAVHERTLFHQLWDEFTTGDIVVADRGFCGYADFWVLLQRGVDCLMRNHQRRSSGQKILKRLGKGDYLVTWFKTKVRPDWMGREEWLKMPGEMTVRQIDVTVEIEGFRTKNIVLVTTLLDRRLFPKASFAELYRRRWYAELFLRDIKTSMGMDVLKCKSPEMVIKELAMYLIAYNLIRTLMIEAAEKHGGDPLRISFKRTADALRQWSPLIHAARSDREKTERLTRSLLYYIARLTVPNRPDRTEPRAIKRRKKNYQLLNKPRQVFKEIAHRNKYQAGLS
jgi:hypothetical protein